MEMRIEPASGAVLIFNARNGSSLSTVMCWIRLSKRDTSDAPIAAPLHDVKRLRCKTLDRLSLGWNTDPEMCNVP